MNFGYLAENSGGVNLGRSGSIYSRLCMRFFDLKSLFSIIRFWIGAKKLIEWYFTIAICLDFDFLKAFD